MYVTAFSKLKDLACFCEKSMQSYIHTRTNPGNIFAPKKGLQKGQSNSREGNRGELEKWNFSVC